MVFLLFNDSSVTWLNLEAVFDEGTIHVSLLYFVALFFYSINMQAKGEIFIFLKEVLNIRRILNVFLPLISVDFSETFPIKMETISLLAT